MISFFQDLRYSARLLRQSPVFTIAVVLSIAIGIGANAAIFSLINGILLKPLPFKDPERLVNLTEQPFKDRLLFGSLSVPNYKDCKEQAAGIFENVVAYASRVEANLTGAEGTERVVTRRITGNILATFEVSPTLGRWFSSDELESDDARVAIISESLWKRYFAKRRDVIGAEIALDREVYKIVGVAPSIFEAIGWSQQVDVMLPLNLKAKEFESREAHVIDVIARLKPAVTVSEAQAQFNVITTRIAQQYSNPSAAPAIKVIRSGR
ncbi:MAG TPA: ABC transporter permease [Chthoniobacterales bacterium]